MPRLIDAEALERKWQYVLDEKADEKGTVAYVTFELFIERLQEEPTIDPESLRPHGRWVRNGTCNHKPARFKNPDLWTVYKCSECGYSNGRRWKDKYCSNCGATMDEEEAP